MMKWLFAWVRKLTLPHETQRKTTTSLTCLGIESKSWNITNTQKKTFFKNVTLSVVLCLYCMLFGRCLEGVWKVFGKCLEGVWKVFGRCLEGVWKVFGRCMEGVWKVYGRCMEGVWKVFGRCMEGVWKVYGRCMEGVWKVYGRCLEGVWKVRCLESV